jgi:hypothetical protein
VVADDIEFSTREMGQSAALTGYLDIASDRPQPLNPKHVNDRFQSLVFTITFWNA